MFVLRMHSAGGSVNLQKAVTETRTVNSLDVIAKHKILDVLALHHNNYLSMLVFSREEREMQILPQQKKELSILLSFVTISLLKTFGCSLQAY